MSERKNALPTLPVYQDASEGVKKTEKKPKEGGDKPKKDVRKEKVPAEKEVKVPKKEGSTKDKAHAIVGADKPKKDGSKKKCAVPEVLLDFVARRLHAPLETDTMIDQFRKFKDNKEYKKAIEGGEEITRCGQIMSKPKSKLYQKFKEHCTSAYCLNEFMCLSLLTTMLDNENDDYDKFVKSFHDAWERYYDQRRPGERVNCYVDTIYAALLSVFWDTQKNTPKPLSDKVIVEAEETVEKMTMRALGGGD
jgi:hypothetical protein